MVFFYFLSTFFLITHPPPLPRRASQLTPHLPTYAKKQWSPTQHLPLRSHMTTEEALFAAPALTRAGTARSRAESFWLFRFDAARVARFTAATNPRRTEALECAFATTCVCVFSSVSTETPPVLLRSVADASPSAATRSLVFSAREFVPSTNTAWRISNNVRNLLSGLWSYRLTLAKPPRNAKCVHTPMAKSRRRAAAVAASATESEENAFFAENAGASTDKGGETLLETRSGVARAAAMAEVQRVACSATLPVKSQRHFFFSSGESRWSSTGGASGDARASTVRITRNAPPRFPSAVDQRDVNSNGLRYPWPYTKRPAGRCVRLI
mmetsp:Transcript_6214/g.20841  ORF Transcript_6214/g.20841 Transcript_6214/m.20841 type:complete len:326 (+) Transcript_6214:75-1052(+)